MIAVMALVVCVTLLAIQYMLAKEFYRVAEMKGFTEKKYFVLPFLLGIGGMLLVISLPDRSEAIQAQVASQSSKKESEALPKL